MRQSSAEIDHAILDVAAGIFAAYGFQHASVQQIADAVGYSKPGLLHRFGSKEALHRAVLREVAETAQEIVGQTLALQAQPDRITAVLELVTRKALARPGMVQVMLEAFDPAFQEPGTESTQSAGYRLVDALDRPLSSPMHRLRIVLALKLIVTAARTQRSAGDADLHVDEEELVPVLVSLAQQVMGAATVTA